MNTTTWLTMHFMPANTVELTLRTSIQSKRNITKYQLKLTLPFLKEHSNILETRNHLGWSRIQAKLLRTATENASQPSSRAVSDATGWWLLPQTQFRPHKSGLATRRKSHPHRNQSPWQAWLDSWRLASIFETKQQTNQRTWRCRVPYRLQHKD